MARRATAGRDYRMYILLCKFCFFMTGVAKLGLITSEDLSCIRTVGIMTTRTHADVGMAGFAAFEFRLIMAVIAE